MSHYSPLKAVAIVLLVAAAYFASGWVGLLLALPPGYATGVWPASGVAVAAALAAGARVAGAGVWLGSFVLNLRTGLDGSSIATVLESLPVPAAIAAGAAVQALVGAWLARRFVGYRNVLVQEMDVVRILLLAGPLACLINATVGVGALVLVGAVPANAIMYSWWTWWAGDSMGVMVFAPVVLAWTVRPYSEWWPKQLAVTVPVVVLSVVVATLFAYASGREQRDIERGYEALATDAGDLMRREVDGYLQALYAIRGLYATSQGINGRQFEAFGKALVEPLPAIDALEWAPLVSATVRSRFEKSVRADGVAGFRITDRDPEGRPVAAPARAQHFPIHHVAPLKGNAPIIGFDLASEPERLAAIVDARDSGRPVVTPALQLLTGRRGILVLLPIYWHGFPQDSVSTRRQNLHGFAVAAVSLERMLAPVEALLAQSGAAFRLYDDAAQASVHESGAMTQGFESAQQTFRVSLPFYLVGRPWRIEVLLPATQLLARRSWQAWGVLFVGMLLTSLVGILLLLAVGRAARIQALVEERTTELRQLNRDLVTEVERRRRLEAEAEQRAAQLAETNQELQRRDELNRELLHNLRRSETALRRTANELASSNRELEQFAYVASHDLKAPLRTISSFAQLLDKRYAKSLGEEAREFLTFIGDGIRHMQGLIDDLLQLSRVDARSLHVGRVSMAEVARQVCRQVSADLDATGGTVHIGELPDIDGDTRLLAQLLQNLIANGIKFQKPGSRPEIRIDARAEGDLWHFTVADNGIGIAENHLSQIFMIFKRLHTPDQYPGSGIGLAICRKVVQLHGGEIWASSVQGEGTTIHFTLPRFFSPAAGRHGGRAGSAAATEKS